MKKFIYILVAYCIMGSFPSVSFAQDQAYADSIIRILNYNKSLPDSTIFSYYNLVAENSISPDVIISYGKKALEIGEKNGYVVELARSKTLIAIGLMQKGQLVEALDLFFETANIYEKAGIRTAVAGAYNYIAQTFRIQNNHKNSIHYYKKAIEILRQEDDSIKLASILLNLGYDYYRTGMFDSALVHYDESRIIFHATDYELGTAYNLGNIGLVYAQQGKYEIAESKLSEAIAMLVKFDDKFAISEYENQIASIYKEKGNYDKALSHALHSYTIAKENDFKELIKDATHTLSELYKGVNNYEKAYAYYVEHIAYRDSINSKENIRKMADLQTAYEVSKKQTEIDLLNKTKETQFLILLALAIILLLVGILAIVIYRNYKQKKAINIVLEEQKEELQTQNDQLDALNKTKDKFFSIISHDIRGPVNAFNGISHLIRHYISVNDMKNLVETSEYIDKSASQLSSLLDNLLDWAVKQQGEFPYNPDKVHLNKLIDETLDVFRTMAHAKHIRLSTRISYDIFLWADSNSLMTILRNLVSNALKFTKEGSVTISAEVIKEFVEIKIADTGVGISEEKLETLFKLSEKKRSWGTAGEKGLGLGLMLAYEFTKMNNGLIKVESKKDKGTTFIITIPLYEVTEIEFDAKLLNMVSE